MAEIFNHGAWFWMSAMIRVSEWAGNWSIGCINIRAPSCFEILTYYVIVGIGLCYRQWRARWRLHVFGCVFLLLGGCGFDIWRHRQMTRIDIVPLHGGEAVFLSSPRLTGPWLMDCGNALDAQRILKPFLRGQGVNRLSPGSDLVGTRGYSRPGSRLYQGNRFGRSRDSGGRPPRSWARCRSRPRLTGG